MNISKVLQEKVDAKLRQMQLDPEKGTVFSEDAAGNKKFTEPTNQSLLDLTDTPASYTGEAGKALIVKLAEDGIEFGAAGADLPDFMEWVDTYAAEGLAVFDDPPTNSSMVALIGKKGTETSVYAETTQADFEKGELEDTEATAAGLRLGVYDAAEEGAIPEMTSNTEPSGVASASSEDVRAWNAFDQDSSTRWYSKTSPSNEWVRYEFPDAVIVIKYKLQTFGDATRMPKDWTFQGSNDAASWTTLDTVTNETGWAASEIREFEFTNSDTYTYYQIVVSANNGGNRVYVCGFQMYRGSLPSNGQKTSIPQDLTTLSTDPGLEVRWTATTPTGTTVSIETAVKGETAYTDENIGTGNIEFAAAEDTFDTANTSGGSYTYQGNDITTEQKIMLSKVKIKVRNDGSHALYIREGHGKTGALKHSSGTVTTSVGTGGWYEFTIDPAIELDDATEYHVGWDRPNAIVYFSSSYSGSLWSHDGQWLNEGFSSSQVAAMGLVQEDALQGTFYLPAYPAERHSDVAISVDSTPTAEFTRANANDPREIIFNSGHEPDGAQSEIQTLDLGGADGGTYKLGTDLGDPAEDSATLNWNDDAATIETALEGIYGAGNVTVAADSDFTITFATSAGVSGLEFADIDLTNATTPGLTLDTAYVAAEAVTATYTGVTNPSETAEVQTLYLGGATGGTFTLSDGTTTTSAIAYDASAADIETELEAIFGTGLVTVAADTDFTITFSVRVRASGLTADLTGLTGATSPTLTATTAYSAGDWEEQTTATAISNIPAGSLVGQHLWIRQTLETDDTSETPTLTEAEVYYGTEEYNVFTVGGTVGTL